MEESKQTLDSAKITLQRVLLWIDNKDLLMQIIDIIFQDLPRAGMSKLLNKLSNFLNTSFCCNKSKQ